MRGTGHCPRVAESKSVCRRVLDARPFALRSNALIIGSSGLWPRTCISAAVTVSAPALASLNLPVVPSTQIPEAKGSKASQTSLFKDVFDDLALLKDPQQDGGTEQDAAAQRPPTRKQTTPDLSSGADTVLAPQVSTAMASKIARVMPQAALPARPTLESDSKSESNSTAPLLSRTPPPESATPATDGPSHVRLTTAPAGEPAARTTAQPIAGSRATSLAATAPSSNIGSSSIIVPSSHIGASTGQPIAPAGPSGNTVTPKTAAAATAASTPATTASATPSAVPMARPQPTSQPIATLAHTTPALQDQPSQNQPSLTQLGQKQTTVAASAGNRPAIAPQPVARTSTASPIAGIPLTSQTVSGKPVTPVGRIVNAPATLAAYIPTSRSEPRNVPDRAPAAAHPAVSSVADIATSARRSVAAPVNIPRSTASPRVTSSIDRTQAQVPSLTRQDFTRTAPGNPPAEEISANSGTASVTAPPPRNVVDVPADSAPASASPAAVNSNPPAAAAAVAQSPSPSPPQQPANDHSGSAIPASSSSEAIALAPIAAPADASVEFATQPTPPLPVYSAPASSPAPRSASGPVANRADERPGIDAPQPEASSVTAPKAPLAPQPENLAFALRMLELESAASNSPQAQINTQAQTSAVTSKSDVPASQPAPSQNAAQTQVAQQSEAPQSQPPVNPAHDSQSEAAPSAKPQESVANPPELAGTQLKTDATVHEVSAAVFQVPANEPTTAATEPNEARGQSIPLAAPEARMLTPELPRSSASSEILLHLAADGQPSAAIRVADRAGTVSVSVHAADPILRESLKSNLGELSAQLDTQGWKTDVVKSAAIAAHADAQQESHAGEQRGSSQQQSSGGDRQAPRDRRGNGGQWQQELDQQLTSSEVPLGGNR
jgi:hypothetical protein